MTRLLRRRRPDDRGAFLILGAVFASVAVVAAALAVDIGSLVLEKRSNQRTADMAALDAVRGLEAATTPRLNAESNAVRSASRNGFVVDSGTRTCGLTDTGATFTSGDAQKTMLVEVGKMLANASGGEDFVPIGCPLSALTELLSVDAADAVRVTLSSPVGFSFVHGSKREQATAVAKLHSGSTSSTVTSIVTGGGSSTPSTSAAGVRVGSRVAAIDSSRSAVLNSILAKVFAPTGTPPAVNVTAVGYQGLANAQVSLADLATALGLSAGSVDQVLGAQITYQQLLAATATVLSNQGDSAAAATVNGISQSIPASFVPPVNQTITLGQLGDLAASSDPFNGSSVSNTKFDVLELVRGGAVLADGDHFVSTPIPGSISIPGVASGTVEVSIIEAPQASWGPVGTSAHTAQLRTTLKLTIPINLVGIGVLNLQVPVVLEGGGADGTITAITCDPTYTSVTSVTIGAVARTINGYTGAFSGTVLGGLLGTTPLLSVSAAQGVPVASATPPPQSFVFNPAWTQVFTTTTASMPSLSIAPSSLTVKALGIGVPTLGVDTTVASALNGVLGQLNGSILPPLYDALGIGYASADVESPATPTCAPGTVTAPTTSIVTSVVTTPPGYNGEPILAK